MTAPSRLPETFLRGLEADLRALCTDARRKSPHVKEAAERVILALKQADTPLLEAKAADNAASAFCVACEPPSSSSSSTSQALQIKVVLRAVSSLHKLLTHRAISTDRLPQVLDALQRLAQSCVDDTVTLKVLQGLLSLLTVRSYAKALSEDQLARAFSLLFVLKTSRSNVNSNPASNALSAISQQMVPTPDSGVIEQTSKAAFRQVSSDLFAAAADAAVQTAVKMQTPSGELIPLEQFPSEAKAAHSLLMDLCRAVAGEPLSWLSHSSDTELSAPAELDLTLALEVIDDGLASNIALFAAQPIFSQLLGESLCPVIHKLLKNPSEKQISKSLFGLIVTVLRNYWRILQSDAVALVKALQASCDPNLMSESEQSAWSVTFAIEALRNIFSTKPNETNIVIDFINTFDLNSNSGKSIAGVIDICCMTMISASQNEIKALPVSPVTGTMKPFANTITNTTSFLVAAASGLYIHIARAALEAVEADQTNVAKEILSAPSTDRVILFMGNLINTNPFLESSSTQRLSETGGASVEESLAKALTSIVISSEVCGMHHIREKSLATLAGACVNAAIANASTPANASVKFSKRLYLLFEALFLVISKCRFSLGPSWPAVVDALEQLDSLILREEMMVDMQSSSSTHSVASLKPKLKSVFVDTVELNWDACHEMISALVQSSRQAMIAVSKRLNSEDMSKSDADPHIRVFGIVSAEAAILTALRKAGVSSESVPSSLWQLLTGHLTSVCADSPILSLRIFALNSLTRMACGAVTNSEAPVVSHDTIVTPFLDLFNSSHSDVRSGSLSALHTLLESQGEHLRGEAAWKVILSILTTAAGLRGTVKSGEELSKSATTNSIGKSTTSTPNRFETDMVSEGFKVVQVIADDFLSSLAKSTLPTWVNVLGLYCRQVDDLNVALTAIGLLWRTADFIAKSSEYNTDDSLWVEVFHILKEVSMDDRPEIRNCAVKTLTGALSAHSFRLSARAWSECAEKALLPLLEEVMQGGSLSGQLEDNVSTSRSRGDVQVMLHHSRDTPRKQWNETKVLALSGVAKVLRSAMPRLAVLQDESGRPLFLTLTDGGSNGLWRNMLRAAGVAAASRDGEVAIAGVSAMLELLSAAGFVVGDQSKSKSTGLEASTSAPASLGPGVSNGTGAKSWVSEMIGISESHVEQDPTERGTHDDHELKSVYGTVMLWEAVWSALAEAIGGAEFLQTKVHDGTSKIGDSKIVDENALQMLAVGLIEARKKLQDKFTSSSSRVLVQLLMYLAVRGIDDNRRDGETPVLSVVQESILKGFNDLSFGDDVESWIVFIQGLLNVLPSHAMDKEKNTLLTRRVLEILSTLYSSDKMPSSVKNGQLKIALPILGKLMMKGRNSSRMEGLGRLGKIKSHDIDEMSDESSAPLWALAAQVILEMMSLGSPGTGHHVDAEWTLFADIVSEFLFEERRTHLDRDYRRGKRDLTGQETFDLKIIDCIAEGLKDMNGTTSFETKRKLVRIISRGAEEGESSGRRRFVRSCQKKLFILGEANWGESTEGGKTGVGIAAECGQYVVETCARVLGQYIADGQRAGRCPLPAGRRAEAVFLLQQLRRMLRKSESGGSSPGSGSRKHVLALYPRLCECVESRDEAIRYLARELLDETSPLVSEGNVDIETVIRRRRSTSGNSGRAL